MKSVAYLVLLPSLFTSVLATFPVPEKVSTLPTVPNKFIIEVDQLANIPNKRSFKRSLDAIYSDLQARDVLYDVIKEFDTEGIFLGAALALNSAKDAIALENTPGVKAIRPVRSFKTPELAQRHILSGKDDPDLPPDTFSTHVMTGVDKVHAEGNIGNGIKIGIIDTGIDYKHPSLGGGFGQGFLVSGGYDFVGDAFTGANQPVPDSDPYDNCNGHGTHVAGIIAAQPGNEFNISGVAYGATLLAYRVFGCEGFVTEDIMVDALLRGHKDGNDILTLSISGSDGWAATTSAIVASRIARAGTIVTIAAGNDGDSGSWYSSSPGNAYDAISVASVDNTVVPLQQATVHGVTHDPIVYYATLPLPVKDELPIYALSKDTTIANDACDPLPSDTPDLSPYLVIIRRGTCAFTQKLSNIAAKGAKAALIYDNGNGFNGVELGNFTAALIQAADGEFLVQQFAAGVAISISFPQSGASINYPVKTGGLVSSFSTYGPSNDFHFKPAVAAPGGGIISTFPLDLSGGFAVLSGTSMATPFVAGVSALLLTAKGKSADVAKGARDLFETTSNRIPSSLTDGALPHTLTQAGAGLINAYKALHTTTIVSPGELILNDTAHFKGIQSFTVKNTGNSIKNYKLTHLPAGTALTVQPNSIFAALGPVPTSNTTGDVFISPSSFILLPGQSLTVIANFVLPQGLDASLYPVYSGAIEIASSGSDVTHVSYLGLAASLKDKQVVDNTDEFFGYKLPAVLDATQAVQTNPKNYTFANSDFPSLVWRLAFGTPALRVDLVDAAIQLTPTYNKRDLDFGPLFTFPLLNQGGSFAQVKVVGPITSFDYIPRHNEDKNLGFSQFNLQQPTFANGTVIPNGAYRFLFRALRVTGNPQKEEDYESWLSPIVGVQPSA